MTVETYRTESGLAMTLRWVLLAALIASTLLPPTGLNPGLALVVGELPVVIAIWHFAAWTNWRTALAGFAIVYVVAYTFEFVGTHTGLVFGEYYYSTTAIGPLLFKVPILLPLGYFAMAYGAYIIARLMLRNIHRRLGGVETVITAALSSLVMTAIDLSSDPIASTLLGKWVWVDGGSYFGVPVHNYLGWLATTFTFFLLITIMLNVRANEPLLSRSRTKGFYAQAIVLYATFGMAVIWNPLLGRTGEIYDAMAMVAGLVMTIPIITAAMTLRDMDR